VPHLQESQPDAPQHAS
jgi:hypothetical protein